MFGYVYETAVEATRARDVLDQPTSVVIDEITVLPGKEEIRGHS